MAQNLYTQFAFCKQHPWADSAVLQGGWVAGGLPFGIQKWHPGTRLTGHQGKGKRWICTREVVISLRVI